MTATLFQGEAFIKYIVAFIDKFLFCLGCIFTERTFSLAFRCIPVLYIFCVCVFVSFHNLYTGGDKKQELLIGMALEGIDWKGNTNIIRLRFLQSTIG